MDLTAVYLLLLPAALYVRATRILGRRGYRVPALQQVCWFVGLAAMGVALLSPLDELGETDLLSAHMGQHLLIGDIAAPLLILGLRSPVYAFVLPRPVLVPLARAQPLRRLLRFLRRPWIAAPLWIVILYGWHFSFRIRSRSQVTRAPCRPAPDVHHRVAARVALRARAHSAKGSRRALEDRAHHRRPVRRHVPGDGVPVGSGPRLRRLLRPGGPPSTASPHSRTSRSRVA